MHLRYIDQCYDELIKKDPNTALSRTGFRRMVISGVIPSIRAGRVFLVDLDSLELFLSGGKTHNEPVENQEL